MSHEQLILLSKHNINALIEFMCIEAPHWALYHMRFQHKSELYECLSILQLN